jgi:GTPase KRas
VFLFVYSIIDSSSFEDLKGHHELILREKNVDSISMVIIGNKCDLEEERVVSLEQGREYAQRVGGSFFETSAKTRINIENTFKEIFRKALKVDQLKLKKDKICILMYIFKLILQSFFHKKMLN